MYLSVPSQHSLGKRNKVFFRDFCWNHKVLLRELLRAPWAQGEPVEFPPGVDSIGNGGSRGSWFSSQPCAEIIFISLTGGMLLVLPARILLFLLFGDGIGKGGSAHPWGWGSHSLPTLSGAQHPHQKYLCFAEGAKELKFSFQGTREAP